MDNEDSLPAGNAQAGHFHAIMERSKTPANEMRVLGSHLPHSGKLVKHWGMIWTMMFNQVANGTRKEFRYLLLWRVFILIFQKNGNRYCYQKHMFDCETLIDGATKSQETLEAIANTMYESDLFPRGQGDLHSHFWTSYERIAKQSDEDFLERHNGDLDVQLIFECFIDNITSLSHYGIGRFLLRR